jgi:hypothetical protein
MAIERLGAFADMDSAPDNWSVLGILVECVYRK